MFGPSANVLFVLLLLEWLFGKLSAEPFVTGYQFVLLLLICLFVLLLRPICFYKNCGLISEER
jgi:hypothetical protein